MDRDDPAYRGQADYTRSLLRLYDPVVLGLVARAVWRCPTSRLVEGYRQHIRDRHLDVGPGTGYFLERSGLPDGSRVTILDPNPTVLRHAAGHLRRLEVTDIEADVLKPLPVDGPFESAALHLVIHCLPGPMPRKTAAVATSPPSSLWTACCSVPRDRWTPDQAVAPGARRLQSARRVRQPRRHGGRAPRDPCRVIRARGARDRRLDRDLLGDESAPGLVAWTWLRMPRQSPPDYFSMWATTGWMTPWRSAAAAASGEGEVMIAWAPAMS